jgi:hypothetical protein
MVRLQTLDLRIGVRVPASQPNEADILETTFGPFIMRTLIFSALLGLLGVVSYAQDKAPVTDDWVDKASPEIDAALRARVNKFYGAFIAGKFKEAYLLVADDSQDQFIELSKDQYISCEIIKTRFSRDFMKAEVVVSCKGDFKWHGLNTPQMFPLSSNWKIENGEWCWAYVRPTKVRSPFSPTGFAPVPPEDSSNAAPPPATGDIAAAAQGILAKVSLDKHFVKLKSSENSQDIVHVRNEMPGSIGLKLDKLDMPGLKVTLGKAMLAQHEETTIAFEWRLDDPQLLCVDCAKKMTANPTVFLRIIPTAQTFPINIYFENQAKPAPAPTPAPPVQK